MGNTVRDRRSEAGFSLVELCVVLVVVSVLLGIAVPVFFGARERASDAEARARAVQALKAHAAEQTQLQLYTSDADAAAKLEAAEPNLDVLPLPADGVVPTAVKGAVYVGTSGSTATLVARSTTGTCYWIRETDGVKEYGRGPCDAASVAFTGW